MINLEIQKRDRSALITELETAGASFKGNACTCPYHDDKHPSAGIFLGDDGAWRFKCQTCNVGGDVYDIRARNTGKLLADVLREAEGGMTPDHSTNNKPSKVYPTIDALKAAMSEKVQNVFRYFDAGGEIRAVVLRSLTDSGKTFKQARPCNGGFELRAPEKPWTLFNLQHVMKAERVVVCEGERTAYGLLYFGVVATTSMAGAGKAQYSDWQPLAGKTVYLWADNDEPGRKHIADVQAILQRLEPAPKIYRIDETALDLPTKGDAIDYIQRLIDAGKNDADIRTELHRLLSNAQPIRAANEIGDYVENCIAGLIRTAPLPWRTLDGLSHALRPGTITLICAGPGATKSFMLLQCLDFWMKQDEAVSVLELEEDTKFHIMRMLAQRTGEPGLTSPDWIREHADFARQVFTEHADFIKQAQGVIYTTPEPMTLTDVGRWIEKQAQGKRIIAIDPITAATNAGPRRFEEEANFVAIANKTAVEYGVSLVMLTHPTKGSIAQNVDELAGSSAFGRFCQSVLKLEAHDEKQSDVVTPCGTITETHNRTIHIRKSRNGRGAGMKVAFHFGPDLTLSELGLIIKKQREAV